MSTLSVSDYGLFLKTHQLEHQQLAMDYQAIQTVLERSELFQENVLTALYPELYCIDFVLAWALFLNEDWQQIVEGLRLKQQQMPPDGFIALWDYAILLADQRNAHLFLEQRHTEIRTLLLSIKAKVEQKPWLETPLFLTEIESIVNTRLQPHHQKIVKSLTQTQKAIEQMALQHSTNPALPWCDLKNYLNSRRRATSLCSFFDRAKKAYPSLHPLLQSWLAAYPDPFPDFKTGTRP